MIYDGNFESSPAGPNSRIKFGNFNIREDGNHHLIFDKYHGDQGGWQPMVTLDRDLGKFGIATTNPQGYLDVSGSLVVTTNGNVGIGTTSPSEKLDVSGTVKATLFSGDGSGLSGVGDGLGDHTATQNINLGGNWLSGDGGSEGVYVDNSGNVGIGTTSPSATLDVAAGKTTIADAWSTRSSKRWKTNIKPISDALDKIMRLKGVNFDWKDTNKHDIGLIAEEVAKIIPEIVNLEENGIDAKSLDYSKLVSVLIEAMKAQQRAIEAQDKRIEELEARLAK